MKPSLRSRSVGTKVTEDEYKRLEALAGGRTISEWVRDVLLEAGDRPGGHAAATALAEVLALRTILLNVLFKLANGEKVTAPEMKQLIERADSDKLRKAMEKLSEP